MSDHAERQRNAALDAWDRKMADEQASEDETELAYADVNRHHGVVRGGTTGKVLRTCPHYHPDNDDAFLCGERQLVEFQAELDRRAREG